MFNSNLFGTLSQVVIPDAAQIIFVADLFEEDYVGGAEKSSEALIKSSPYEVFKLHSKDVSMELLEAGFEKYWIFGNFCSMDQKLIPTIIANMNYSIIDFDFKYCQYRSPDKHKEVENQNCDCENREYGKFISAFFYGAKSLFWMSEKQQSLYIKLFPFLSEKEQLVLSSVFDDEFFVRIRLLREKYKNTKKNGLYLVYGSSSWIKGTKQAVEYCEKNNLKHKIIGGLSYEALLEELAEAKGIVYTPPGGDSCPRWTIEAKLLGCELILNDNVLQKDEEWMKIDDDLTTSSYLYAARGFFWRQIEQDMGVEDITLSAYTTVRNALGQDYPMEECLASVDFCDEIVVVDSSDFEDGKSIDGTWEKLVELQKNNSRMIIHHIDRDYKNARRPSLWDGQNKSLARSLCTQDFCLQIDIDEIIHESDAGKYLSLIKNFPKNADVVALPMVEYWGDKEKVRMDINVSKWRVSKNAPYITHGIPKSARLYDESGELYSQPYASDSCDLIHFQSYEPIEFLTFMSEDAERMRLMALSGNEEARKQFEIFFNGAIENLPCSYHYGWRKYRTKIEKYSGQNKGFFGWSKHWSNLYNLDESDSPENNNFIPNKSWKDVTAEDVEQLIKDLDDCGGWIFHSPFDKNRKTPSIKIEKSHPVYIREWLKK